MKPSLQARAIGWLAVRLARWMDRLPPPLVILAAKALGRALPDLENT